MEISEKIVGMFREMIPCLDKNRQYHVKRLLLELYVAKFKEICPIELGAPIFLRNFPIVQFPIADQRDLHYEISIYDHGTNICMHFEGKYCDYKHIMPCDNFEHTEIPIARDTHGVKYICSEIFDVDQVAETMNWLVKQTLPMLAAHQLISEHVLAKSKISNTQWDAKPPERKMNHTILGTMLLKSFKEELKKHSLCLLGGDIKIREDVLYVFSDMYETRCVSLDDLVGKKKNDLIVLCEKNSGIEEKLQKIGYQKDLDYVMLDDLIDVLDCDAMPGVDWMPSEMMKKTLYAPMVDQPVCHTPFHTCQVGSRGLIYPCCPPWTIPLGKVEHNSLDEIWHSVNWKIFRLSMINRTYSFCNVNECNKLKKNPGTTMKRMENVPVKDIASHLEIGIDYTCNLYCTQCRNELRVASEADRKDFAKIKEAVLESGWMERVETFLVGGNGEPFFSPVYKELIFGGSSMRNVIDIRTNGTLMDEESLKKLTKLYRKISIIVSIDAARKKTYDELRRSNRPDTWENLQRNLKTVSELRKEGNVHFFQINMCVQMKNYEEVPEFISMGKNYGCDKVLITYIRNRGTYSLEEWKSIGILDENKNVKEVVKKVLCHPLMNDAIVSCGISL